MTDIYPPTKQRLALLKLAAVLDCRDNALRRDECGDWRINGKRGYIYAIPGTLDRPKAEGFQLFFNASVKAWTYTKEVLSFCTITNDGDGEGLLFLDRLPTSDEAVIIRDKLNIPKKRMISEKERLRLTSYQHRFKRHDLLPE